MGRVCSGRVLGKSMGNSNSQKSSRILALSALAGLGYAVAGFIFGTGFTFLLIFLYFKISYGIFSEAGFQSAILISPLSGLMTAILVGAAGSKLTYQRLSKVQ